MNGHMQHLGIEIQISVIGTGLIKGANSNNNVIIVINRTVPGLQQGTGGGGVGGGGGGDNQGETGTPRGCHK